MYKEVILTGIKFYIDETNNEKWIEEYQFPEMLGGDFPQLRLLKKFPWGIIP